MYKLLIADDDYEIRNGLCKYFPWSSIGFDVVSHAENGREAYTFIQQHAVDVLLCDIRMPIMSGIDLAREVSVQYPNIHIIFFSAYKDFEYAQKALETGVKRYILKSTNYNELVHVFTEIKEELDANAGMILIRNDSDPGVNFHEQIIRKVKEQVEKDCKHVSLEKLAQLVHMHPDYLSKFFKKHTGALFSDYLTQVRMVKAAQYLNQIEYKTYEVSELLGYSNSFNFTRAFKNYYGMTPRDYRKGEQRDEV